ncbi:MAG TPA: ADOP family duplicated permease [Gemmatimonadales bacterium]|nr:ADOP family duplicated permease [Gemmatimonadales bacterium]
MQIARGHLHSLAVGLTLALGVAALTVAFGIVNAALFRQPPFEAADRITLLYLVRQVRGTDYQTRWSFPRIQLLRQSQRSFESLASYSPATLTLSAEGEAETARGEMVSSQYFRVLRGDPAQGRVFGAAEDAVEVPAPVAVISAPLARRRWPPGESPVGRPLRVNGMVLTVIGVMPEGFHGLSDVADLWLPAPLAAQLTYGEYLTTNQNFISVVARLAPGVPLAAARRELAVLGGSVNRAIPSDPEKPEERVSATAVPLNRARNDRTVRSSLTVFLGAVALLHLLACANVTNLLLGAAARKRRESAVRLALGSSNRRLFGRLLWDGVRPAGLGGLLGVLLAGWAGRTIVPPANVWAARNFYGSVAPFDTPGFGAAELGFGLALALVSALLVALPAALSAFRLELGAGIRAGSRGLAGGQLSLRRPTLRGALVGLEAALAMLLVVAAGLLIDSFQRMRRTSLGVDAERVLTFWVIPSEVRVPPAAGPAFVTRLLESVREIPGVLSASVDGGAPLSGTARSTLYIAGRPAPPADQAPPVLRHYVAPEHFGTLGIPLLRGRGFSAADAAGAPHVTVMSASAARRFWPGQDPLGQRVWFGGGSTFSSPDSAATIIGVVGDVVYEPLDQHPNFASFYTPYLQFTYAARMVFLKTAGPPLAVAPEVRKALARVDPDLSARDLQPLTELVSGSWARHRFDALLFGAFGIAALLLAASGTFAVLAFAVANRTREFGIRIALGAHPALVVRRVLREGMGFPLAGLLLGAGLALGFTRVLRASLYEVSPLAPAVYLRTALLLLLVSALACLVPAWRATRADPLEALRAESSPSKRSGLRRRLLPQPAHLPHRRPSVPLAVVL